MAENRITCTKCGTQLSGATIQQILEWDKTHVCPAETAPPIDPPKEPQQ